MRRFIKIKQNNKELSPSLMEGTSGFNFPKKFLEMLNGNSHLMQNENKKPFIHKKKI